ncbi:Glutathione S-transferase [Chamberlinius hualienensis]
MPATIYGIIASPPTRSVILTAKLVGLDFTLQQVNILQFEQKTEEYRKISATQTVPGFQDEDGFRVFDSHAIATYIVGKYAKDDSLYPKDLKQRAAVDSMLHFNNSGLFITILDHFIRVYLRGKPYDPEKEENFKNKINILNNILGERPYAAGDHITLADIFIVNSLSGPTVTGYKFDEYPNVDKWLKKMEKELKYYDEVVVKGLEALQDVFKAVIAKRSESK